MLISSSKHNDLLKLVKLVNNWIYHPDNKFHMWDITHIVTIVSIVMILIFIYLFRDSLIPYRDHIRISIGILLIVSRLSIDIWYVVTGNWDISHSLPLELCSIASLSAAVMLLTKNHFLFEIVYFIGIGGAIQAIFTPNLLFGFPQFRYIQFFVDHFCLILAPLIMIWLYQFTITKASIIKAFISINLLAFIVFIINTLLGANYMFLKNKPSTPSLLNFFGPYPYYLFTLEFVALFVFFILYLPFKKSDASRSPK